MVKKSTFLEKLFGSRKTTPASRGQVRKGRESLPAGAVRARPEEVKQALEQAVRRGIEPKTNGGTRTPEPKPEAKPEAGGITRVLGGGRREEAAQALTDGFKELGGLLKGIHERMDVQGKQSDSLNAKFSDLPAMARAQVEFMTKVSHQLVEQREKTGELLGKLSGLPDLLDGIHKTLARQTAVEERTEKSLADFRKTMDRIHGSIGTLTKESQKAVKEATDTFERSHSRTTRVFEETQKTAYEAFEKTQSSQMAQITKLVERTTKMNRGMVVLLVLVFASLVALFAIVLGQ